MAPSRPRCLDRLTCAGHDRNGQGPVAGQYLLSAIRRPAAVAVFCGAWLALAPALAFEAADLTRLDQTGACPGCDLSLASWPLIWPLA